MGWTWLKILVCSFALALLDPPGRAEIVDRIVAIVNDDIITLSELERFRRSFFPRIPKGGDPLNVRFNLEDARRRALDDLIEEKLIEQEAKRRGIQVSKSRVKEALESFRRQRGLTKSQFEAALRAEGLTYEDIRQEVINGLRKTTLVNQVVRSKVEVKEEDVRSYYQTHINDYRTEESVRITHIRIPLPPNATGEAEASALSKAEEIVGRAEKGEDLASLARTYSQSISGLEEGDLGYFKKGEMIPALEKEAFSLPVGGVGGPIRTPDGVVIIQVTDRKEAKPIPLAEIRKRVEEDCYRELAERLYRRWLAKLKKRSFIEVKL
ncbi:MAG: peptidyl-prolyl cis-trans isomerase [Deltaproteobacteria bacterium]|nr:peptidyl-prolyl cis-trans isomerase [Deltaproteobacteria bacterium]